MLRTAIVGGLVILPAGMPLQRASINAADWSSSIDSAIRIGNLRKLVAPSAASGILDIASSTVPSQPSQRNLLCSLSG